jgi:hypothetical protein
MVGCGRPVVVLVATADIYVNDYYIYVNDYYDVECSRC